MTNPKTIEQSSFSIMIKALGVFAKNCWIHQVNHMENKPERLHFKNCLCRFMPCEVVRVIVIGSSETVFEIRESGTAAIVSP